MTDQTRLEHKPNQHDATPNKCYRCGYVIIKTDRNHWVHEVNGLPACYPGDDQTQAPHPLSFIALADQIDGLRDAIAEHDAEMRNEVALFGDSWPGSAINLREMRQHLAVLEHSWNNPLELPPFTSNTAPDSLDGTDRSALQAIADMAKLIDATTDYRQLLTLAIAIAQVQLEGKLS